MGALGPRSSPAHVVWKYKCTAQQLLDLVPQLDAKQLSAPMRARLHAWNDALDRALWPDEPHAEEQRWALAEETWAACDQACAERGIDLRYFHIGRELHGALRFNEKATIGAVRTRHPWPFSSALTAASPHRSSSPTPFRFSTC